MVIHKREKITITWWRNNHFFLSDRAKKNQNKIRRWKWSKAGTEGIVWIEEEVHLTVRHVSKSGGRARVTVTRTLLPAITMQQQGDDRGAKGKVIFWRPSLPASNASASVNSALHTVAPPLLQSQPGCIFAFLPFNGKFIIAETWELLQETSDTPSPLPLIC